MRQKVKLSNDTIIEVDNTPFASGGEADIYEIVSPTNYTKQILKIYKTDKITRNKEDKLNFLINNKPNLLTVNDHHSVIWPIHLAYISNKFVGYTMPKASGIKLELLCHPKLPKTLSKEWEKFSFNTPGSIQARLKLCYNISAAISQIHSFGSYVLVDMKPDNVMVKPDGLISIIDIDSTEIIKNNSIHFPAQVATPEYTPPEYYKTIIDIEKNVINETWDRFSLAIIFYRILFGIHPFTASLNSPFENLTNISDIIQKGFLPVGKTKGKFKTIPPPHNNFYKLEKNIQNLFTASLEESINNPNIRPTADDWCRTLSPIPDIKINRILPSKSFPCLQPFYSESIKLSTPPSVTIDKPDYLFIKNPEGLISKLIRLIKKSEKEKAYEKILLTQNKVNEEYNILETLIQQYEIERNRNLDIITVLLKREKSAIEQIHASYLLIAKQIDAKAEDLIQKEKEEYISFEKSFGKEYNSIEFKIKEEYELTVNAFVYNHTKEQETLLENLSNLNSKETEQIKQLDIELKNGLEDIKKKIQKLEKEFSDKIDYDNKAKHQNIELKRNQLKIKETKLLTEALEKYQSTFINSNLSQFKITDEKYSIFTDMYADPDKIALNLARNGIVTAADIKGVDESGRILKSNGTWVKVSDVALTRAKKLDEWRKRKERLSPSATPPQSLPYSEELNIKNIILPEYNQIDEEERLLKQQIIQSKNNIPKLILLPLTEAKNLETKITNEIQAKKFNLSNSNKIKREQIQNKINELNTNYTRHKLNHQQVFEKKTKELKYKIDDLKKSKEQFYIKTKKIFDPKHDLLIRVLRKTDDNFKIETEKIRNNTVDKMNEIKTKLENTFDIITSKLKDNINSYNYIVNQLIKEQTSFSQMK